MRPAELLATIGADVVADVYGDGGVVAELESTVAELLGFPAAVFLPSGTMAQAATLRVHADARGRRTVLWHPSCHLATHEGGAYSRVHGLVGRAGRRPDPAGDPGRSRGRRRARGRPAAGAAATRPRRAAAGLGRPRRPGRRGRATTGPRPTSTGPGCGRRRAGYGRPPAEIASLFDTAYVSFYKGIGALAGCCVVGPAEVVAQVREWRRRLGGTLYGLWPGAASALALLPERLAEMPARLGHARAIAAALAGVDGVRVLPDPPQTPMMHLLFAVSAERFAANARRLADERGIWVWPEPRPTDDPAVVRCELSVGRATCRLDPQEIADILGELCR